MKKILVLSAITMAAAALPTAGSANCGNDCNHGGNPGNGSSGGPVDVPAPGALALFGLAALGLAAKRRRQA